MRMQAEGPPPCSAWRRSLCLALSLVRTAATLRAEARMPKPAIQKGSASSRLLDASEAAAMMLPMKDSNRSAPMPATSPTLSPTLSAMVARVVLRDVALDLADEVRTHVGGLGVDPPRHAGEEGDGGAAEPEPGQVAHAVLELGEEGSGGRGALGEGEEQDRDPEEAQRDDREAHHRTPGE